MGSGQTTKQQPGVVALLLCAPRSLAISFITCACGKSGSLSPSTATVTSWSPSHRPHVAHRLLRE